MQKLPRLFGLSAIPVLANFCQSKSFAQSNHVSIDYSWKNINLSACGYLTGFALTAIQKRALNMN